MRHIDTAGGRAATSWRPLDRQLEQVKGGLMAPELYYLTLVTVFTALLWVPYILNEIKVRGLIDAVGYPSVPKPLALWAQRMKAAHYNSVENLVIFATLVLVAHAANVS